MRDLIWKDLNETAEALRQEIMAAQRSPQFTAGDSREWHEIDAALCYQPVKK
jgi:protein involved in temperature-dependent protein secretion